MIKVDEKLNCSGCHSCSNVCPANCISMIEDNEGFLYPKIDDLKCINCGLCEKACPIVNYKERINDTAAFACINNNSVIRSESSSGGMFTLIAESVINAGGVVFGAGFDENFELQHSFTDTIKGLSQYRGAKYLQSMIGETYKQVKEFLEKGIEVLFSGTPCQISGLIAFLGQEYDNLICIDIICHGVPSPRVFKMYRTELEKKHGSTTRKITFRCKDCSWKKYSILLSFNNDTEYKKDVTQDVFMRGFLQNLFLRPSCYACKSKSLNRLSDITIADFWGINNIAPELDDDKGTSLVLVNSGKGKKIFKELQNKMIIKQVDVRETIKYNISALESAPNNPNRDRFFLNIDSNSDNLSALIIKYTKTSYVKRIHRKIRALLSQK